MMRSFPCICAARAPQRSWLRYRTFKLAGFFVYRSDVIFRQVFGGFRHRSFCDDREGDGIGRSHGKWTTPLVFLPPDVKVNAHKYVDLALEGCLMPWAGNFFAAEAYTFQTNSAASHKAKKAQEWHRSGSKNTLLASSLPSSGRHTHLS